MHRVRREKMANSELSDILRASGFRFNKALGQNFIFDGNLTLTARLAARAKKVFSFEVDERLRPVLDISLKGAENVEVVFRDVTKMKDDELREMIGGEFKVVANLPYYITTPLIMRFAESTLPVSSLTVMVQKEVADRLTAEVGSADYAAVTLAVKVFGDAAVTRIVDRHMFRPAPNVDSAVVRIDRVPGRLDGADEKLVRKLVRAAFAMRRKTLVNNLAASFGMHPETTGDRPRHRLRFPRRCPRRTPLPRRLHPPRRCNGALIARGRCPCTNAQGALPLDPARGIMPLDPKLLYDIAPSIAASPAILGAFLYKAWRAFLSTMLTYSKCL